MRINYNLIQNIHRLRSDRTRVASTRTMCRCRCNITSYRCVYIPHVASTHSRPRVRVSLVSRGSVMAPRGKVLCARPFVDSHLIDISHRGADSSWYRRLLTSTRLVDVSRPLQPSLSVLRHGSRSRPLHCTDSTAVASLHLIRSLSTQRLAATIC